MDPSLAQPSSSGKPSSQRPNQPEPILPIIVLVAPQLGENIGMCARAMLNCGLDRLRLVAPRDGWPNPAARATAADADHVLDGAQVFARLDDALADCHRVLATSARPRSLAIPRWESADAAIHVRKACQQGEKVAVLFGAEASGLDNDAAARAEALIHFPTNPDFASLNLAQSVLLFGWEWRSAAAATKDIANPSPASSPAPRAELDQLIERWEQALAERDFFLTPELKPLAQRTLRGFFTRSAPEETEIRFLHGVLTALLRDKAPPGSQK